MRYARWCLWFMYVSMIMFSFSVVAYAQTVVIGEAPPTLRTILVGTGVAPVMPISWLAGLGMVLGLVLGYINHGVASFIALFSHLR